MSILEKLAASSRNITITFGIIFFILVCSHRASAQVVEGEKGIYLDLKFIGSSLHVDENGNAFIEDDGGGLQFDFGYRFNPVFALGLSFGAATHETTVQGINAKFAMLDILAFYRFCPDRPFRPYLKGGLGGYSLMVEENGISAKVEGGGIALGGGFKYFFSEHFALGVDLTHNIINYDKGKLSLDQLSVDTEIDEDSSQTSLGITFCYSF